MGSMETLRRSAWHATASAEHSQCGMLHGVVLCCLQVLPLLVHNLVDDQLTKLVCTACDLAMRVYTRNLPESFSEQDLVAIDKLIIKLRDALQRLYGRQAGISFSTPKFHKLSHLTTDIRRLGHPKHYNSDRYETTHCLLKLLYRCVHGLLSMGATTDCLVAALAVLTHKGCLPRAGGGGQLLGQACVLAVLLRPSVQCFKRPCIL